MTTLAWAVASQADGAAWWADLAGLPDEEEIVGAVIDALGLEAHPGVSTEDALRQGSRRQTVCWSWTTASTCSAGRLRWRRWAADLALRLRVLVTRRMRLGHAHERVYPVQPLRLAGEGSWSPAMRLFADRAHDAAPDLVLGPAELAAVDRICRRLDGLRLTLELATSRVGGLSLQDLDAELADRLRCCVDPATPRHRTVAATVEWSLDLLTPREQTVFAQLSVFPSGFGLEAARAVIEVNARGEVQTSPAGDVLDRTDVADVVARLFETSMVTRPLAGSEPGTYRMLETIRAVALDRLVSAELNGVRRRHARLVASEVAQGQQGIQSPAEAQWSVRLERLVPDVRVAVGWAVSRGERELASRIIAPLHRFAYWRLRTDVLALAAPVLDLGTADAGVLVVASAAWQAENPATAAVRAREAIVVAGGPDDPRSAVAHDALGDACLSGDLTGPRRRSDACQAERNGRTRR